MSQSVRATKSSTQAAAVATGVQLATGGGSVPHKFSSIVNKVESLISKMHHDKVNNFKLLQQQGQEKQHEQKEHQHQHQQQLQQDQEQECKCASLDSLNNLTDEEQEMLYTDSDDAEIAHITGTTAAQVHRAQQQQLQMQLQSRRSDLDQLTNESIRELNEQCCLMPAERSGGDLGLANDNAWSVEEDIVYKCCTATTSATIKSNSSGGSLCEQCCLEEHQLTYKLQMTGQHVDSNNNHNHDDGEEEEVHLEVELKMEEQVKLEETNLEHCLAQAMPQSLAALALPQSNVIGCPIPPPGNPPALLLGGGTKTRRVSNASSGSVSRMETILEEPTESKISVKEILARFETMNSNEVM